jgi:hypothetical protein
MSRFQYEPFLNYLPNSNESFSIGDQAIISSASSSKRRSSLFIKDRLNYLKSRLNNPSESSLQVNKLQSKSDRTLMKSSEGGEQIRFFLARHAERIDQAIGNLWYEKAFDQNGRYQRINLNLPNRLPYRSDKKDFIGDSPITEGKFKLNFILKLNRYFIITNKFKLVNFKLDLLEMHLIWLVIK